MFGRRSAPRLSHRVRNLLWPAIGWRRVAVYRMRRLARLEGTPHTIAAGLACGVAVSVTPLLGFHILLAAMLALVFRGSLVASAAGTFFANPWTIPVIWLASLRLGSWMLFGEAAASVGADILSDAVDDVSEAIRTGNFGRLENEVWPVLLSMMVGSVPLGLLTGGVTYWSVRRLVLAQRERRLRVRT